MKFLLLLFFISIPVWTASLLPDSKPVSRILGGQPANAGQYPWLAAIYKQTAEGQFFCGGSIYNEQWILTAAQCVVNATSFTIQVGSNQLQGDDPNRVTVTARTYFYEPRFDPTLLRHDIGLIKLDSPLTFNDHIQAVRQIESMSPIYNGVDVDIAGWGQTSNTGDIVNDLQYIHVKVLGQTECATYFGDQLWGSMVCTVGNYNEGPCFGDTGGPLMTMLSVGNYSIQVGIASFISGNGCESTDPKGYTRTDAYYWWAHDTVKNNTLVN